MSAQVGERLKAERLRLGLTQVALAKACGMCTGAQKAFEAGRNLPGGSYLIAAAKAGVDIQFVLLGWSERRGPEAVANSILAASLDDYTDLQLVMVVLHAISRRKALRLAADALHGLNETPVTITFPADPVAVRRAFARAEQLHQAGDSSDGERDA